MTARFLRLPLVCLLTLGGFVSAQAQDAGQPRDEKTWRHATSLIKEPKYGPDFAHYDYVNVDAPKGGTLNQVAIGTFDSLNPFIIRGTVAAGLGSIVNARGGIGYDSLMEPSEEEPSTSYALIAEAMSYPDDYSSATFRLNPKARWHDGEPITAEDVVWSFETLKEINPQYNQYYHNVVKAEITGEREVTFTFDQKGNRELPNIMGDLVIVPKHWWTGTDKNGNTRDITQPTLEPPLSSGPYRIKSFIPGRSVVWERVPDYWGKDHPLRVGRYNFDEIRYEYFRDANASWEAFTKGGIYDFRAENRAQRWAQGYDFPAVQRGDVKKEEFETTSGEPMQAYVLNTRRDKFADRRVRRALTLAFDFESLNKNLFFGLYSRTNSYFEGTELEETGLPEGQELEYLEKVRDKVPPEVFTEEFKLPVYDSREAMRDHLREAVQLLREAGWEQRDGGLFNKETGERFTIQFLGNDPNDEKVFSPYANTLRRLGIETSIRIVDAAQYQALTDDFDYDVIAGVFGQSQSPGNEQREYWGSYAADQRGSRNAAGIKNEAVDQLVNDIVYAPDRQSLVAATRALDRVLLWNYYMVPQWNLPKIWLAYWNKFGIPEEQPSYMGVDVYSWWIDPEKEKKLRMGE
ncbi:microcin C transport system substrate-binding protein [Rhodopseudomonas julia]|uniref:Microcin C transport system substrate-binding protein n=1 Tax=Rhodopseudomonas julia TaxID=200617 RepID=A0ABU0C3T7_9BRAD|nr:extracellular solute-binding protein [Rhodopseudomonas julia]MDQ0325168.1 microcin C transport system substrate-binding protein [Rhodopseudomonas julia]